MNAGFLRVTLETKRLKVDYLSVSFDDPPISAHGPRDSVTIETATAKTVR